MTRPPVTTLKMTEDDMSLSKLREVVMDREAWRAAGHRVARSRTRPINWTELSETTVLVFWCGPLLLSIKALPPLVAQGWWSQPLNRCPSSPPITSIWNKANFPFHQLSLFIGFWVVTSQTPQLSGTVLYLHMPSGTFMHVKTYGSRHLNYKLKLPQANRGFFFFFFFLGKVLYYCMGKWSDGKRWELLDLWVHILLQVLQCQRTSFPSSPP